MSIVICYDGSDSAKRSLAVAQRVLGDKPAVLLHIWNSPDRVSADAFGIREDDKPSYEELEASALSRAHEILDEGKSLADRLGIAVTPRDERNRTSVSETILEVADELNAELIVAGTHGTTAVQTGLLGSVSNTLVHKARRPVLVVPVQGGEG
jgi:nucleotide-binding universal stress UspA family protein